jgi:hypothetical protein
MDLNSQVYVRDASYRFVELACSEMGVTGVLLWFVMEQWA